MAQPNEIYLKYNVSHFGYITIFNIDKPLKDTVFCVRIHKDDIIDDILSEKSWTYKEYKTLKGAKNAVNRILKEYMFDYELKERMCGPLYNSKGEIIESEVIPFE